MKFFINNDEQMDYLCGKRLSTGMTFNFPCSKNVISRINYIEKKCINKKVIHVGCLDHTEVIEKKIKSNTWLHQRITDVSQKCIGIDINSQGIKICKEKYGINNILLANIAEHVPDEICAEKFDLLLLPDVIEHISDPLSFLSAMHKNLSPYVSRMLITTPYAFRFINIKKAIKNQELINTDHRFWFTPYTLSKLLVLAGFHIKNIEFMEPENHRIARFFLGNISLCYDVFSIEAEF